MSQDEKDTEKILKLFSSIKAREATMLEELRERRDLFQTIIADLEKNEDILKKMKDSFKSL